MFIVFSLDELNTICPDTEYIVIETWLTLEVAIFNSPVLGFGYITNPPSTIKSSIPVHVLFWSQ